MFDHTASSSLPLWGAEAVSSIDTWKPSWTVLLITGPSLYSVHKPSITIRAHTFVEVDPNTSDAAWMRRFAQRLTKRNHVNPTLPFTGKISANPLGARLEVTTAGDSNHRAHEMLAYFPCNQRILPSLSSKLTQSLYVPLQTSMSCKISWALAQTPSDGFKCASLP